MWYDATIMKWSRRAFETAAQLTVVEDGVAMINRRALETAAQLPAGIMKASKGCPERARARTPLGDSLFDQ
jgi:hypothetical protein